MRKRDRDIIGRLRRAVARAVGPGGLLGLAVAGAGGADPASMRVTLRLRGGRGMDGAALVALARRVRQVMRLPPGMRLPMLVIRWIAPEAEASGCREAGGPRNDAAAAGRDAIRASAGRPVTVEPEAEVPARVAMGAQWIIASVARWAGFHAAHRNDERRRSRSPPSPWSVWLSACG